MNGIEMIGIQTPAGYFKVWTKRIGDNPRIKVLLLHGGPGLTHEYLECFENFLPEHGFEIIEYDQLGSYYSDQPSDNSLWTSLRFVNEIEQVRKALNLNSDNFFLFGHSGGGILAMEYALRYQQHLKGLVISNMMASMPEYDKYNNSLRSQMPQSLIENLETYENEGRYQDINYQEILMHEYNLKYLCRLPNFPEPVLRSLQHMNTEIREFSLGPNPFKTSGNLKDWDLSDQLKTINVPVLVIGAKYDTMDPQYLKWMSAQLPNGDYLHCENGSHLAMWDDQQTFMTGLIDFINKVDQAC